MTDIKRKALALLEDVIAKQSVSGRSYPNCIYHEAIELAIEQHEAFKQEVSDALVIYSPENRNPALGRFIINADKPDALVDVWGDLFIKGYNLNQFCDALDARGLEIRKKDE
jgi:hypothetical protein